MTLKNDPARDILAEKQNNTLQEDNTMLETWNLVPKAE